MYVSKTSIVSQMAMMPTRAAISLTEGAITFEGAELPDEEKARVRMTMGPRTSHPSHTVGRYLASTGDGELDFCRADTFAALERSDAHTSELQSLMRISYAAICLH